MKHHEPNAPTGLATQHSERAVIPVLATFACARDIRMFCAQAELRGDHARIHLRGFVTPEGVWIDSLALDYEMTPDVIGELHYFPYGAPPPRCYVQQAEGHTAGSTPEYVVLIIGTRHLDRVAHCYGILNQQLVERSVILEGLVPDEEEARNAVFVDRYDHSIEH